MAIFFLERGTISVLINNETGLWWAYRSKNDNHRSTVVCVDQAELLSQLIDRAYLSSAEKMYAILLNCIQFAMAHRSSTFETCGQQ